MDVLFVSRTDSMWLARGEFRFGGSLTSLDETSPESATGTEIQHTDEPPTGARQTRTGTTVKLDVAIPSIMIRAGDMDKMRCKELFP
jgi:hypothetical protein